MTHTAPALDLPTLVAVGGDSTPEGRYRRIRRVGVGGMGEVWLGEDTLLGRSVAIKRLTLTADARTDPDAVNRILREARTAAALRHPNAVAVYDLVIEDGVPLVIMEYVDGESVAELVRRSGPMPVEQVARFGGQVASALAAAHARGIVHRDIKPGNILIDRSGDARLVDFGIARADGDDPITEAGSLVGTIAFMAPEAAQEGIATPESDVWSLGATMYSAVEGHGPLQRAGEATAGPTVLLHRLMIGELQPVALGGPLGPLIGRILSRQVDQRPSAAQVAQELHAPIEAPPVALSSPPRSGPVTSSPARTHKRPWALILIVGAVVLAAIGGGVALWANRSGSPDHPPTTSPASTRPTVAVAHLHVTRTVAVGPAPVAVAVAPGGKLAYVALAGNSVVEVDLYSATIRARIALPGPPDRMISNPRGRYLYVLEAGGTKLSTVDRAKHAVRATIAVGTGNSDLALAPDGASVYLTRPAAKQVVHIDLKTGHTLHTITTTIAPTALVTDAAHQRVFAVGAGSESLQQIDTRTDKVVRTVSAGPDVGVVTVSNDGTRVYTGDQAGFSVRVYNSSLQPLRSNDLDAAPTSVSTTPSGRRGFLSVGGTSVVAVDFSRGTTLDSMALAGVSRVAVVGGGGDVVAISSDGRLRVIATG